MNNHETNGLLISLAGHEPTYATTSWHSWLEVETAVNHFTLKSEMTDGILRPLLHELRANSTPWTDILLLLCWRSLLTIHHHVQKYEQGDLDRWEELTWQFLEVLHRFDLSTRPAYIGRKIFNDTQSGFLNRYRLEKAHGKDVRRFSEPDDDDDAGTSEMDRVAGASIEYAYADLRLQRDWTTSRLRKFTTAGHLTRAQYLVLVGRHLYGRSMANLAVKLGVTDEAAKKQYLRALEKLKKVAPNLSPYAPDSPLYQVRRARTERKRHGM